MSETSKAPSEEEISRMSLPVRLKHPYWSLRLQTYQQLIYNIETLNGKNEQFSFNATAYRMDNIIPML